ncbi:MAG: tetratricopeptide repeat protein [Nitrospirae bacterium]|nr:tetratricopeptide repeat protein [Nitrospirota bacterium]
MADATLQTPAYKRMKRRAGLLGLLVSGTLIVAGVFIAREKGLFTQTREYRIRAKTGNDLFVGMDVKLLGVKIGTLKELRMTPEAKISGVVEVDSAFERWVRADSELQILKSGFIGGAYLEMTKGTPEAPALPVMGTIDVRAVGGLEDIAENVSQLIGRLNKVVEYIDDPGGDVKKTLVHAEHIAGDVELMMADIHKASPDVPKISKNVADATEKANALIASTQETVEKMTQIAERLDEVMVLVKETASKITLAAQDAQKMIGDVGRVASTLPETVDTAERALREVTNLSRDLREGWLVKSISKEEGDKGGPKLQTVKRLLADTEIAISEEKFDTALAKLARALETARSIDDQEGILRGLTLLGSVYQQIDRENEAEKPLKEAYARSASMTLSPQAAEAAIRWAEWNVNRSDFAEASTALRRAEPFAEKQKDSPAALRFRWVRALTLAGQGQLDSAGSEIQLAVKRADRVLKPLDRGRVYEAAGDIAVIQGRAGESVSLYDAALQSYKNSATSVKIGRTLVKLAQAYQSQKQPERSLEHLARAYDVQKASGQNDSALQTLDTMVPILKEKKAADQLSWVEQEKKTLRRPGK